MKNIVTASLVTLILVATLAIAFDVRPVKAAGAIHIRADGSIDPPTAPIVTLDNVTYTLKGNVTSDASGIVVEKSNIIVDGAGYTLQGTGASLSKGIDLTGRTNVTVRNTHIKNFYGGIWLGGSSNYSSISGNNITSNDYGIVLSSSSNNSVSGNTITANNDLGIGLISSNYNSVTGNTFTDDGLNVGDSYQNVVEYNTVNGKPLVYLEGVADRTVSDAGQVILVNSTGIRVENLNLSRTSIGVQLWQTRTSIIAGNTIADNNGYGIGLSSSSNNSVSGNTITNNAAGIALYSSSNNSVSGNNITANNWSGVNLHYSSNYNSVSDNTIANNDYGIYLTSSSDFNTMSGNNITANRFEGVKLEGSSGNTVSGNNITANNWSGVNLHYSSNNSVSGNNITANNARGIGLYSSSNNSVSGNNITNNGDGIVLDFSSNYNSIIGNNITSNDYGIALYSSSNNSVSGNNITANNARGIVLDFSSNYNSIIGNTIANNVASIWLYSSSNNSIGGNNITANNSDGIWIESSSSYNSIFGNTITANNYYGIVLYSSSNNNSVSGNTITANNRDGIYLVICSNNSVSGNNITANNWSGIWLSSSSNNSVSGNNITANNGGGIRLSSSSNNRLYHNNLIGNSQQVSIDPSGYSNVWDDGYPSGGNYWSDYTARYPGAEELDDSGIWDTPYVIDADNQDNYPLINPWTSPLHKFGIGDWVQTTANLNVHTGSGLNYTVIGTMPLGTVGQVLGGPAEADGFVWWDVNYTVGVRGWSAEDWLEAYPCVLRLQKSGVEIDEIAIGEVFDIYVGDTVGDIRQVRFSSDDAQDGTATGVWTAWCDWDTSSGDWDASTKIKRWTFASYGDKEVWTQVNDAIGVVRNCSADIFAVLPLPEWKEIYAPNPWGYGFKNNKPVDENIVLLPGDESLTWQSRWDIFEGTFDLSNVDEETLREYFRVLNEVEFAFTSGCCYGMAASSLMEFAYRTYDQFMENQGESTIFELEEPPTVLLDPSHWLNPRWHGGGEEGPDPVLEHILEFQLLQYGQSAVDFATILSPLEFLGQLEEDLSNGKMYVLGIGYSVMVDNKLVQNGHAVVPYQVAGQNILIYDPNWPNNDEREIEIYEEEGAWKWRYRMGVSTVWPPDDYTETFLVLYPVEALYNSGEKPQCKIPLSDSHEALFYIDGEANLVLIDLEGRSTGLRDGSFLQEVPNVEPIYTFGAFPDEEAHLWRQAYHADGDTELTITISGFVENGTYSLTKFGPGYFASISSLSIGSDAIDNITITSNGAAIHVSQNQDPKAYNLTLNKNMNGVSLTFTATAIPVEHGATHQYAVDWNALLQGEECVTVLVDADGDGKVDRVFSADSELTSEEFIEKTSPTYLTYALTITAGVNGTTFPALGTYACAANATIHVTALPDVGYALDYWELDSINVGSTDPCTIQMGENHTVNAVFRLGIYDVAVTSAAPSKTIVGEGYRLTTNVTAANLGDFLETFNLTLYASAIAVETMEVILAGGSATTITFTWNATGFAYGNYTWWAYADPVPGEANTVNNAFEHGWVIVTIPGDVDGDRDVDIFDIVLMARDYGKPPPVPFDPNCDVDGDGDIDIFDIVIAAGNYGNSW